MSTDTTTTVSNKQLAANRKNAKRSTGPKTPEGKAAASANAIKHGLCSLSPNHVVILDEDPDEFAAFQAEVLNDLRPAEATERVLAERIVLAQWRLRRAARYEGHVMDAALNAVRRSDAHHAKFHNSDDDRRDQQTQAALEIPRAIDRALAGKAHRHMVRYEGYIERGLFRAIEQLKALRWDRISLSRLAGTPRIFDPVTNQQYPGDQYHNAAREPGSMPPWMEEGIRFGIIPMPPDPHQPPTPPQTDPAANDRRETNPFEGGLSQVFAEQPVTPAAGDAAVKTKQFEQPSRPQTTPATTAHEPPPTPPPATRPPHGRA